MNRFPELSALGARAETRADDLANLEKTGTRTKWEGGLLLYTPLGGAKLHFAIVASLEPDAEFLDHRVFRDSFGWSGDAAREAARLTIGRRQWDYTDGDKTGECKFDLKVWERGNFFVQTRPNGLYGPEGENPLWTIAIGNIQKQPSCLFRMPTVRLKKLVVRFEEIWTKDEKRQGFLVPANILLHYMAKPESKNSQ